MSTVLNWESFSPLFGDWANRIKPFFDSGGLDPIYEKLKKDGRRGKRIAPLPSNVFRCLKETPFDEMKAVLVGMCPYHSFYNNLPIADGLLMSCSVTGKMQPSLQKFYDAMEKDLWDEKTAMPREPNLSYLAKQGVVLLNAALTVEESKPGSHNSLWEPFMRYLFEEAMITIGLPVVFLGKEAAKLKRWVYPFTWTFEITHPAYASYSRTDWDSEDMFNTINRILKDNNNTQIEWIKTE